MTQALPLPSLRRGFTLIEIMVVIAIIVAITVIALPAIAPLSRASKVNTAAALITDNFNYARQLALTQNKDIEVRFYKMGSKTNAADLQYRALRCFAVDADDNSKSLPLGKISYLPEPVIISDSTSVSPLLDYANASRSGLTHSQETIPGNKDAISYVSFLFRATGGTNLSPVNPPTGNWYLTIYLETEPKTSTGLPANYFTAQIDPVTGRVRGYRP